MENQRKLIGLSIIFLGITAMAVFFNYYLGQDKVYTHLFYILIILIGVWFHRSVIWAAALFACIHILLEYLNLGAFSPNAMARGLMMLLVALILYKLRADLYVQERDLLVMEKKYRFLVEDMDAYICSFLPDGTLNYMNPAYLKSLQSNAGALELIGQNHWLDAKFGQPLFKKYNTLTINQPRKTYEQVLKVEGQDRWIRWTDRAYYDQLGEAFLYQSTGIDITEQKQKEKALEASQLRYIALINANPDMMFVFSEQGEILDFEGERRADLYQEPEIFLSKNIIDVLPPQISFLTFKMIQNVKETRQTQLYEYMLEINEMQYFESRMVSYGENKYLAIVRNITNRKRMEQTLENNRNQTVQLIIKTLYEKNEREEQHSERVGQLCVDIGEMLGLTGDRLNQLRTAGLMHDIGKIGIEEKTLNKPGKLSDSEWLEIKRHPETGYRILSSVNEFAKLAEYVLAHHERWDGKGYPKGLKGEEIPLEARIIAIADTYDAMTSDRPYRKALNKTLAIKEIQRNAGKQFDPYIAGGFVEKVMGNDTCKDLQRIN